MTASAIPCANPRCENRLTYQQLQKGGRYCSLHCATTRQRAERPQSIAALARRAGIAHKTARRALQEGRYTDGVYTPIKRGRPKK